MSHRLTAWSGMSKRSRRWAVAILALALAVRLGVILATDYVPRTDAADYQRHAVSISEGRGYPETGVAAGGGPTAFRPPLYPYFLAGIYEAVGENIDAARVVQAVVGTVGVALIGIVALLLWGQLVAGISMALAAVYPPLLLSGAALISEPLFLPLELGAFAAAIMHRRASGGYRWAVAAGVLVGLGTLTRPNGVVLVLPIALGLWTWRPRLSLAALSGPIAMLAAALLVVTPWTIRNAIVMDEFIPISTQAGYTLAGTYNDTSRNDPRNPASWRPPNGSGYGDLFRPGSHLSEVATERELRHRALEYISDHPAYVLEAGFWNTVRMLELTGFSWGEQVARDIGISPRFADLAIVSFWLMAALAVVGTLTSQGRRTPLFLWLALLVLMLSVVFISGTTRYRTPVEPFVIWFAALAVQAGYRAVRGPSDEAETGPPIRT